jgi:pimeloyl-ACP methyl ester carboxylesterase
VGHDGARLHAHGYAVVAYDARGHGDSDWDPGGEYDVERFVSDLTSVRAHISADRPPAVVGASLGGMIVLASHLLAPPDLWAAVVLVDITPRIEFHGARRVVSFMAAHPDGFDTLDDAADVIAEYNPRRLEKAGGLSEDMEWVHATLAASPRTAVRPHPRR